MHRRLCTTSELDDAGLLFPVMERFKSVDLLDICTERPCRIHSAFAVPGSSLASGVHAAGLKTMRLVPVPSHRSRTLADSRSEG